jgi:hypothetical protein
MRPCSHAWRDAETWQQLVGNFIVAPYIEAGNPKAMQPGHTYYCGKCQQTLSIPRVDAT